MAVLLGLTLVLTACAKTEDKPVIPAEPVDTTTITETSEWEFEVSALDSDLAGIDADTEFKLTSKNDVSLDFLKENVEISPKVDFQIMEKSSKEFIIKPKKELDKNKIYNIKLYSKKEKYDFSWAFQTKKDLMVVSSIPGNRSEYVPVNSGIEIMFNYKNIENFDEIFEISPKVEGKFSSNGYAMIFIPHSLERGTTYSVSIKAGARVEGSDLSLQEDYAFSFNTEPMSGETHISLNYVFFNFKTDQNHFIPAYISREAAELEYDVSVFAFDDSDTFLNDVKEYDKSYSFEKLYENIPEYLQKISEFKVTPVEVEYGYSRFYSFEFSEALDIGYYLTKISYANKDYYCFVQVNDLLVYSSKFEDTHFFWLMNGDANTGVKDALITVDGEFTGKSGDDGVAIIDYQENEDEMSYVTYAKIESQGFNDFIMRNMKEFHPYMMQYDVYRDIPYNQQASKNYWKYIFSDRSTYLPTDKMNLFGYINPKIDSSGNYKISLYSNVNGFDLIESKTIQTTNTGTFTDGFSWKDMTPGWYTVLVEENDTLIIRHDLYINEYTKPVYKIEGEFDKEFIKAGESITYNLNAGFFDGTPVPGMGFNYYMHMGNQIKGKVTTDESGNASVTIKPSYKTTSWRPTSSRFEINNTNAEDYRVTDYDYFTLLPKDKMIELSYSDEEDIPKITVLAHELDSEKFSTAYDFNYEDMRGKPLNTSLSVKVTERWYEKIEKGQVYDYINKVNKTKYDYIRKSKIVEEKEISVVDGKYTMEMPYVIDSNSRFEVEVTFDEGNGERIVENLNIRDDYYTRGDTFSKIYRIRFDGDKYRFKLNETVDYYLDDQGRVPESPNDKFLLMHLKDGLMKYEIKDELEGSFVFGEEHLPNFMIKGVYSKDGNLYTIEHPTSIQYDYSEREISIDVEADKKDYGPGEKVVLNFKTKDAKGNPYPTQVNISIVDEAYFDLYGQSVDILRNIYSSIYSTGIISEYASSDSSGSSARFGGAEGGGGDGSYYVRSEFKDTATFMTVSTDENGMGELEFNLPDNLTSWRITYQGINDKMEAANGWININAKLPFRISTILSKYFITGDEPSISLRIFGEEAEKGSKVSYNISMENDNNKRIKEFKEEGIVGEYTNISLGVLKKGKYTVTIYADGKIYNDALVENFEVVDSTVYFNNKKYYDITKRTKFSEVYSNAEMTFFNESESNFYNSLLNLRYIGGKRIDQIIAGMEAREFIKDNFEPDLRQWETAINSYQNFDGGIKLLPYSDSDAMMSARIALLSDKYFNIESMITYFYSILYNQDADMHSVVAAYTGLAAFNEPVLLDIYELIEDSSLTQTDRIMLTLGLEALGEKSSASDIYMDILSKSVNLDDKIYFDLSMNEGENFVSAGLLSTLAVKLGDNKNGDKMFDYLYENPSKYEIAYIERLIYIMNRNIMDSEQIKALSGEVTIKYLGNEETFEIFGFESKTITLTPEEFDSLKIKNVVNDIGAYVYALGGVEDMKENKTDDFSITREYAVDNQKTSEFNQSDLIKVTLSPITGEGAYRITDFIPAGFRFVKLGSHRWYEEQGQKLIFHYSYSNNRNNRTITYYIQAVMPGVYTADHAVITKNGETGTNFTEQELLIVK